MRLIAAVLLALNLTLSASSADDDSVYHSIPGTRGHSSGGSFISINFNSKKKPKSISYKARQTPTRPPPPPTPSYKPPSPSYETPKPKSSYRPPNAPPSPSYERPKQHNSYQPSPQPSAPEPSYNTPAEPSYSPPRPTYNRPKPKPIVKGHQPEYKPPEPTSQDSGLYEVPSPNLYPQQPTYAPSFSPVQLRYSRPQPTYFRQSTPGPAYAVTTAAPYRGAVLTPGPVYYKTVETPQPTYGPPNRPAPAEYSPSRKTSYKANLILEPVEVKNEDSRRLELYAEGSRQGRALEDEDVAVQNFNALDLATSTPPPREIDVEITTSTQAPEVTTTTTTTTTTSAAASTEAFVEDTLAPRQDDSSSSVRILEASPGMRFDSGQVEATNGEELRQVKALSDDAEPQSDEGPEVREGKSASPDPQEQHEQQTTGNEYQVPPDRDNDSEGGITPRGREDETPPSERYYYKYF